MDVQGIVVKSNTSVLEESAPQLVMDPGKKILTWVGSAIHGLGLGLENYP